MANNIFIELLPPWIETGVQPAFYDKESGTVLQQTARMYAKVNEVIADVNHQNETIDEYIEKFNELHDYVYDYFANLDVQEEVNHKIDEMAEDGTLTRIISAYVNPIFEEYTAGINETVDDINNTVSTQNVKINTIENKVESLASGTPRGVYATVAALTSADPSHDYIYVVTADGNWYYYNTGTSSWTAGGVYQAADGVITYDATDNLYDLSTVSYDRTLGSVGQIQTLAGYNVSDYIPVEAGETYTFLTPVRKFATYDSNKDNVSVYDASGETYEFYEAPYEFEVPVGVAYIRVNVYGYSEEPMVVKGSVSTKNYVRYAKQEEPNIDFSTTNYESLRAEVERTLYPIPSINLINESTLINDIYIGNNKGMPSTLNTYKTTTMVSVEPETTYYTNTRYRFAIYFDEFGNVMPTTYVNSWQEAGTFTTPANAHFARFTFSKSSENIMINKGSTAIAYQPYHRIIDQNIGLTTKMLSELESISWKNTLTGKKLVACGDSFTEYTNASFDSGPYSGKYKTYPYLIGLRNNMVVHNIAKSGSTMANDGGEQVKFSDTLYTTIDADADYILIKYGINDSHRNVALGTIDSVDDSTFYGAWNKVLTYIITNHPMAKIGIIVTNGLDYDSSAPDKSYYAEATKNIALKYGIPTLNEWNDPNVPLLNRTGRSDVSDDIKAIRNATFRISSSDTHENYQCHEYESTFVEDFLRRL